MWIKAYFYAPVQQKCWFTAGTSDGAPGGKAGPAQSSSGACNVPEWLEALEPGSTPSQPSFKACSGGEGILLEIPVCLGPSEGKQLFFLCFFAYGCCIWANPHLLQPWTLLLCCHCCAFHCVTLREIGEAVQVAIWNITSFLKPQFTLTDVMVLCQQSCTYLFKSWNWRLLGKLPAD